MKLKALLFATSLLCLNQSFAANAHSHPSSVIKPTATNNAMHSDWCYIDIKNYTDRDFIIYGTFDDGAPLVPFNVPRHDVWEYITLGYDDGYCPSGMNLTVVSAEGDYSYTDYVRTYKTFTSDEWYYNWLVK